MTRAGASGGRAGQPSQSSPRDAFTVVAEALVFGFPATDVELSIRRRALGWRAGGAARTLAIFMIIAPVVAIVPPHAPWAIGALVTGAILARRRWNERFTLQRVEGPCPKCGEPLTVKPARLRLPHPLACESCHHQAALRVPPETLRGGPATTR